MNEQINLDMLAELCGQLERAWQDRQDRTLVYELSDQFPQYREDLYEFFEDLILGPAGHSNEKISQAEDRVAQWLGSAAFDLVVAAAGATPTSPTTQQTASTQTSESEPRQDESAPHEKPSEHGTTSASWLVFLRRRTKQKLPNLVQGLSNVTTEYLVLVGRHPHIVPQSVKARIAQDVEHAWGVPVEESFSYLAHEPAAKSGFARSTV
jgi:hypothetical protein